MPTDVETIEKPADSLPILTNGAKLFGETFIPGASLIMDGKVVNGAVHAVLGLGARAALGPVGFAVVAADSYSKSVTDKHLWDHVSDIYVRVRDRRKGAVDHDDSMVVEGEATPDVEDAGAASGKSAKASRTS